MGIIHVLLLGILLGLSSTMFMDVSPIMKYLPVKSIKQDYETDVMFDDIIGHENIKADVSAIVNSFIQGDQTTKGMIFTGNLGSGKTMMAKAIMTRAIQSNIPFVSINSRQDLTYWIKVAHLNYGRCVIFHDEADLKWNPELLKYLDGATSYHNDVLLVFATTNHIDDEVRAISRSNRIDKIFNFELPSYEERLKYIQKYLPTMNNHSDMIARSTSGLTFADLSIISRELKMVIEKDSKRYSMDTIIRNVVTKLGRVSDNVRPDNRMIQHYSWRVTGYCFLSYILKGGNKPQEINIKQVNPLVYPVEYKKFVTQEEITALLASLLARNIFERHYCGSISSLANSDNNILQDLNRILKHNNMLVYYSILSDGSYDNAILHLIKQLDELIVKVIHDYDSTIKSLQSQLMKLEVLYESDIINVIGIDILNSAKI